MHQRSDWATERTALVYFFASPGAWWPSGVVGEGPVWAGSGTTGGTKPRRKQQSQHGEDLGGNPLGQRPVCLGGRATSSLFRRLAESKTRLALVGMGARRSCVATTTGVLLGTG